VVCKACEDEAERHARALLAEADSLSWAELDESQEIGILGDDDDDVDDDEPAEPYLIRTQAEIDAYPPFPFPKVGDYDTGAECDCGNHGLAEGWEAVRELFCDSSWVGQPGEPALTVEQLKAELRPGFAYGITGQGQFQVYVTEFCKLPQGENAEG
jgi:hypothetical protein